MKRIKLSDEDWDFVCKDPPPCPVCSQPWKHAPHVFVSEEYGVALVGRKTFEISEAKARVLQVMAASYGRYMVSDDILFRAYSDVPDSDVPTSTHTVATALTWLRTQLKDTKLRINYRKGFGYRLISELEIKKEKAKGKKSVVKRARKSVSRNESRPAERLKRESRSGSERRSTNTHEDRRGNSRRHRPRDRA